MTVDQMQILDIKPYLTVEEAAVYMGIGEHTIRAMISDPGCMFVLRIGKKALIKKHTMLEYLDTLKEIL